MITWMMDDVVRSFGADEMNQLSKQRQPQGRQAAHTQYPDRMTNGNEEEVVLAPVWPHDHGLNEPYH